ncbi:trypsin-like peptidase domain-containing protein [Patescibacteria group bacterium]|nr:trypsin-like peptidase domain-containing protein [Patescibacteria group bacterium]
MGQDNLSKFKINREGPSSMKNYPKFGANNSGPGYGGVVIVTILVSLFVTTVTWFFLNGAIKTVSDKVGEVLNTGLEEVTQEGGTVADSDTRRVIVKEESAVISAVKRAQPSVVSIIATKDLQDFYQNRESLYNDPFFDYLFGEGNVTPEGNSSNGNGTGKATVGGGTGFFVSQDGMILTNKHVVADDTADYTVLDNSGQEYLAQVLARDPAQDIAIIKIEGSDFPIAELGESSALEPGQTVVAIGNSLGEYSNTVTKGVISGVGRSIMASDNGGVNGQIIENVIQTDAAINPGNSGGPLVNIEGQVIGINTAIDVSGQLIGFALPIDVAKEAVTMVKETGEITRPYLGVRYIPITPEVATSRGLAVDYGVLIAKGTQYGMEAVVPGSPAAKIGLKENDIVFEINDQKIDSEHDLSSTIKKKRVGESVRLKIMRDGKEQILNVTLEAQP